MANEQPEIAHCSGGSSNGGDVGSDGVVVVVVVVVMVVVVVVVVMVVVVMVVDTKLPNTTAFLPAFFNYTLYLHFHPPLQCLPDCFKVHPLSLRFPSFNYVLNHS